MRNDISPDGKKAKVSVANRDKNLRRRHLVHLVFRDRRGFFSYAMLKKTKAVFCIRRPLF
ncbi:MAG: hypothetical protein L6V93_14215 [Clostridiales bacterium]|nr:MAG: hypothetical protein L6V93_14215 [Clostridiales bacterium]